jgi:hypothetical protein
MRRSTLSTEDTVWLVPISGTARIAARRSLWTERSLGLPQLSAVLGYCSAECEVAEDEARAEREAESHLTGEDELARHFGWFPRRLTLAGV